MKNWLRHQRRNRFVRASLWLIPALCMAAALLAAPVVRWIDDRTRWTLLGLSAEGAREVAGALASSLLTLIVFAFSMLLLAVQMASGQLTPRIITRVFGDRVTKLSVGAFVFAWVYTLAALGRIEERVPQLPVALAMLLSLASVVLFLYVVQSAIQSMRPGTILTDIADDTRAVIEAVYPARFSSDGGEHVGLELDPSHTRTIARHERSAVVLAFDVRGMTEIAQQTGCTIEILPEVGDFVATGQDLFRLYGPGVDSVKESVLRRCVAFGPERTLEQDPTFGFRVIVDIASKALSAAINDPTTAVLAIDQLHHLLRLLGQRQLDTGVVHDRSGEVRLVYRTPDWEDFVTLAGTEIRIYGASSPQVTRRLQAMFEHLVQLVPPQRRVALNDQLSALAGSVQGAFGDPADRALAIRADLQGIGSPMRVRRPARVGGTDRAAEGIGGLHAS